MVAPRRNFVRKSAIPAVNLALRQPATMCNACSCESLVVRLDARRVHAGRLHMECKSHAAIAPHPWRGSLDQPKRKRTPRQCKLERTAPAVQIGTPRHQHGEPRVEPHHKVNNESVSSSLSCAVRCMGVVARLTGFIRSGAADPL